MTTVAIFGAGSVGRALAERFVTAGIDARFGVRDAEATRGKLTGAIAQVPVMSTADAATGADMIVLAVPAAAAVDAARSAGSLTGQVVLDCTNPLRWDAGPVWAPPAEGSVTAQLAAAFPAARVVKGFNQFGAEIQRHPALAGGAADAFFAGDDAGAKALAMDLARQMGFTPRDAGPLRNAAVLENVAVLWIHLATVGGVGRNFAFRIDAQA